MRCNIKKLRKKLGMTLEDVAIASGMSKGGIHAMENDVTVPTLFNGYKVAEALRTSVTEVWPNKWLRVNDYLPENGDIVIAKYKDVYTDRRVTFWTDCNSYHFGSINEPDHRGSQPATHWKYF